jgi:asparagine synthase (glutamine-hydrolysing)
MCGIIGIIDANINDYQLRQAMQSIAHRGPDGRGTFSDTPLHLGHVRLAIQDISELASQPMQSPDNRYTIIFNGEIYNHWEIREELIQKGISFQSKSDTETLLQAYIYYGEQVLQRINGMFAFAIYDCQSRNIFIARDNFGIKPLYYYHKNREFRFASEIKALAAIGSFDKKLSLDALFQTVMLQWQISDNTGFKHVHKLLPGHCISLNIDHPETLKIKKWYQLPFTGLYEKLSEQAWIERLDFVLTEAVERQLLSDRPLAYFLSGGLDSSLLLAIAHKITGQKKQHCYTIDAGTEFQQEGFSNDLYYAKNVAQQFNAYLHILPAQANIIQGFDQMIWQLDEAQGDIAPLLVQQIAMCADKDDFKVLISGAGADDLYSGYRRHQALYYQQALNSLPLFLKKGIENITSFLPEHVTTRRFKKLTAHLTATQREQMAAYFYWSSPTEALALFSKDCKQAINTHCIEQYFASLLAEIPDEHNKLNQMLYYEMNSFLPNHNLNYTDKMSMAAGVEVRVPYLDTAVAALSTSIPPELKMRGTTTKYLLKKVAEKYLPKSIIYRKKTGFGAPLRSWIKNDLAFQQRIEERLMDSSFIGRNIFDQKGIMQLIDDTQHNRRDGSYTILSLLSIESWLRQFAE